MKYTQKQKDYYANARSRWNIKTGAVRSGKTFVDARAIIPLRLINREGKTGLNFILGVSEATIERNVLQPMRDLYKDRIGTITSSNNTAILFGQPVVCIGAEKANQVAKLQGTSIKYCYGDEVAKWNADVFEMLKSRLDKPYSCFDGTCNPEGPTHWFKQFMEQDNIDIYQQHYTIFDNTFLPREFVENLCKEYEGTVYYDRYILGKWARAEGAIYRKFADKPEAFFISSEALHDLRDITIGVDFGGNRSGHAFVARGYMPTEKGLSVVALSSQRIMASDYRRDIDANELDCISVKFVEAVQTKYGPVQNVYWDSAETVLGNSIRNAICKRYPNIIVRPAKKKTITDRIRKTVQLMGAGRFFYTEDCDTLKKALLEAVWNEKKTEDERLDDGTTDIDSLDAFEYTIERDMNRLI